MKDTPHRGPLLNLRGWLQYPESSARKLREILSAFRDRAGAFGVEPAYVDEVNRAWVIPELQLPDAEWHLSWNFAFVGADLHQGAEPLLRAQAEALAALWEWDGPRKLWMEGRLEVEDDAGHWKKIWLLADGALEEESA